MLFIYNQITIYSKKSKLSKKQLTSKREKLIISNESTDQYVKNKCRILSTANRKSECNLVVNKQHNIKKIIQNKLSKKQLRSPAIIQTKII